MFHFLLLQNNVWNQMYTINLFLLVSFYTSCQGDFSNIFFFYEKQCLCNTVLLFHLYENTIYVLLIVIVAILYIVIVAILLIVIVAILFIVIVAILLIVIVDILFIVIVAILLIVIVAILLIVITIA